MKRIPELVAFCKATERDSSNVVPPIMKITTSCGLTAVKMFYHISKTRASEIHTSHIKCETNV